MLLENIIKSLVFPEAIIVCTWLVLERSFCQALRVSFCNLVVVPLEK